MKRYGLAFVFACMMLTGCGTGQTEAVQSDHTAETVQNTAPEGIRMTTEQRAYPEAVKEIRLLFYNDTDTDYYVPESFSLLHYDDLEGEKVSEYVPYQEQGDSFTAIAMQIPAHGTAEMTVDLAAHYEPLRSDDGGLYRIFVEGLSAEFVISDQL